MSAILKGAPLSIKHDWVEFSGLGVVQPHSDHDVLDMYN
jgi:hypothetical protein